MNTEVLLVIIVSGLCVLSCISCQIDNCKARIQNRRFDEMQTGGSDEKHIEQQAGAPLQYEEIDHTAGEYGVTMQYPSSSLPQYVTVFNGYS